MIDRGRHIPINSIRLPVRSKELKENSRKIPRNLKIRRITPEIPEI